MSLKPSQIIIAGLAGFGTALGITLASQQPPQPSQRDAVNPTPLESPSTIPNTPASPVSSSEPSVRPTPSVPKTEPVIPSPTPSPTPVATPKGEPVVVAPPESGCSITMAVIDDPNPPLNVRSKPQATDEKTIVGTLKNNTFVSVAEEENGWLRITDPIPGWIAKNRTQTSCSQVTERIRFNPGGTEAIVKGRIVGGGHHAYLLKAEKGQTITVTNHQKQTVFPTIVTPDRKVLAGDPYQDSQRREWTGQLPATGDYTFEFDSNYKGFEYEFSIDVE